MSLDPVEEQSEDLYETTLEIEISQLKLALDDDKIEEENEMSKFYIKFADSNGCSCMNGSLSMSMTCI